MAVADTDILLKLSAPAAAAGNASAGTAGLSRGRYMSTTVLANNSANGLFLNVTASQNAANQVEYACLFVHNAHPTDTLTNPLVYVPAEVSGGTSVAIGLDPTPASAADATAAQALTIANTTTAPAGVAFSAPLTTAAALVLGSLGPGQCRAIWVRRTAANTPAMSGDGVTFAVTGDA